MSMREGERIAVKAELTGVGKDQSLRRYAVWVDFGGPCETMHITATISDQGDEAANERHAIIRAQHLAGLLALEPFGTQLPGDLLGGLSPARVKLGSWFPNARW
jgi:hypothetical protein